MQRVNNIHTKHGILELPKFAPDATRGGVKGLETDSLKKVGVEVMVVNTYHLMLKPGADLIESLGGIHAFMNWDGVLASDSGGYQVFSLVHKDSNLGKVFDEGVKFKNVYNGDWEFLTPEKSIEIQFKLGTDIMVLLDDVRPNARSKEEIKEAVKRTISWAKRAKDEYVKQINMRGLNKNKPKLVAVIQGGPHIDLREECFNGLVALEDEDFKFDGFGFGGSHLNEKGELDEKIVEFTANLIPKDRFAFALGVGRLSDIEFMKKCGWNLFDCTIPTREARHGKIFVKSNDGVRVINIKNSKHRNNENVIDPHCDCGCSRYSLAYLHHLFNVGDFSVYTILQRHNLKVYTEFVSLR